MNYLAHLFLSQSDVDLMVGNYIADFVKGKKFEDYPEGIKNGILMHREIDSFTDSHEIPFRGKERLFSKYGKYSGVLIDMFYDHVLAREWSTYSPISLKSFTTSAYQALSGRLDHFPERASRIYYYMSRGDWLSSYASLEGMAQALNGISSRASFENNMGESIVELEEHYDLYREDFEEFFPILIKHLAPFYSSQDL